MKSSKVLVKRSNSPIQPPKTIQISQRKKKSSSNVQLGQQYKKGMKQFQSYGKTQKKPRNNYLKQLLRTNGESTNKYRIVTEPVEQRLLYLGNNNFGQHANSGMKMPSNSRSKLQHQQQYAQKYLKLNIRTSNNSKQKLKTGQSFHAGHAGKFISSTDSCKNCQKYRQQIQHLKKQINKICMDKILWKNGQMHMDDVKQSYFKLKQNEKSHSASRKNNITNLAHEDPKNHLKLIDKELLQIKKHIYDLMKDVDSLSAIDYPKMLSLNIFKYDPFYTQSPNSQQQQLKQLLKQLRNSNEGKINEQQLHDMYDTNTSTTNEYNKKIYRNLKNRLGHYLRQNLQLKMRKQILQRSEQITQQSEEYLKKVIEDVLLSYVDTNYITDMREE